MGKTIVLRIPKNYREVLASIRRQKYLDYAISLNKLGVQAENYSNGIKLKCPTVKIARNIRKEVRAKGWI